MTQLTTLDNGLRIVTDHVPSVHSAAVGFWIAAGTRSEDMMYNGAAHMVEHMLFKGTKTRSALDIAASIENVGGHMNAYTSREITSYHAHVLKDDVPLAIDVLSDMMLNSTLPAEEIERERSVILQEIGMCNDTPDDLVFDNFYEAAWPDQALGAPILGTAAIIEAMQAQPLNDYIAQNYMPENIVVSVAGNVEHDAIVAQIETLFAVQKAAKANANPPAEYRGGEFRLDKDLEQSHIVLGFQAPSRLDDLYYASRILSSVLGGGMSSRLFQEVREKRGLVYSIYSFCSAYSDDGLFGVYAGTAPDKLPELVPVVCDELSAAITNISDDELSRAKTQLKTSVLMARESMMNRADSQAKYLIYRDKLIDPEETIAALERVDADHVMQAASQIFTSAPTLSALGPLKHLEPLSEITGRFKVN